MTPALIWVRGRGSINATEVFWALQTGFGTK